VTKDRQVGKNLSQKDSPFSKATVSFWRRKIEESKNEQQNQDEGKIL
jgi:hypothetical protein